MCTVCHNLPQLKQLPGFPCARRLADTPGGRGMNIGGIRWLPITGTAPGGLSSIVISGKQIANSFRALVFQVMISSKPYQNPNSDQDPVTLTKKQGRVFGVVRVFG